jgi:aminocarboxymuconate-semialdehyde decarboxylase
MRQVTAVDIHHHYFPGELLKEVKRHGKALGVVLSEDSERSPVLSFGGTSGSELQSILTDVNQTLDIMDNGKIAVAAVEAYTHKLGYELSGERGETWCRLYNECVDLLVRRHPGRFKGMASVPLQDPVRAAKVLEHAVIELKFSGAFIGSNVNGKYYNSKDFDRFWAKAQELDVLVVMHPDHVAGSDLMGPYGLRLICGNPADSTLSLGFLIYSGVFDRFPNLKLCALHGGGFLPYHLGRFDRGFSIGSGSRPLQACAPPSAYLKNLYFDTLVYHVDTLDYLKKKVGSDHLLVGTDYPYVLGDWMAVEKIEALDCTEDEREAIIYRNAKKLLKLK